MYLTTEPPDGLAVSEVQMQVLVVDVNKFLLFKREAADGELGHLRVCLMCGFIVSDPNRYTHVTHPHPNLRQDRCEGKDSRDKVDMFGHGSTAQMFTMMTSER